WSPDGMRVVFVQLPPEGRLGKDLSPFLQAGDWILGNAGHIATMAYDSGAFAPAEIIVPSVKDKEDHYYPSWSPDSTFILFSRATWCSSRSRRISTTASSSPTG